MKDRIPEVVYYEWRVARWLTSTTRLTVDLETRAIYRDLLDVCYHSGFIPSDIGGMAAAAYCSGEQIERSWPKIKRHFSVDKNDPAKLKNHEADLFRREFFTYVKKQRKAAKIQAEKRRQAKANEANDVDRLATGKPQGSHRVAGDNTKQDNTIQDNTKESTRAGSLSLPNYTLDEQYARFREVYCSTGAAIIEADLRAAYPGWCKLPAEDKLASIENIEERIAAGKWDAAEVTQWLKPAKYIRDEEWKRKTIAKSPRVNGKQEELQRMYEERKREKEQRNAAHRA